MEYLEYSPGLDVMKAQHIYIQIPNSVIPFVPKENSQDL